MPHAASSYRPALTNAGLAPTCPVAAYDEYGQPRELFIARERPLTIYLDRAEIVTLMTLGQYPELLALGYLKNQGLVSKLEDIVSVQVDWEVAAAAVTTRLDQDWSEKLGSRIVTSGCGQGTIFDDIMDQLREIRLPPVRLKQSTIYALLKNLNAYNEVYRSAGAVHGCALCQEDQILIFVEDVGRHNAVDAIAGRMWLDGIGGQDKIFYTTGRLTSEMVIKVAQMRIPVLLSRSGITHMGLELGQDTGVIMISRAQGQHFLVYHGFDQIELDVSLPPKISDRPPRRLRVTR
jgi:FdhD protein